jgi:DHA2 family multidrug resistance protein
MISVLMCMIFLPKDDPRDIKRSSVDWTGIGLLALGLASFQILLEEGQQHDWLASPFIRAMAVLSVLGTGFFIWHELHTPHPAVDLRVLRHRSMIGGSIYSAILGMGLYGIIFAIPVFVQGYLHFTAMQSGELLVPGAIASAIAMMLFGKVAHKFPPQLVIGTGALLTTGTGLLLMSINTETGVGDLFWPLVLRGLGGVFMFMALSIATLGPLPKRDIAAGAGMYSLTRQLGSSIGIALITTMLERQQAIHRATLVEKVTNFRPAFLDRVQLLSGAFPRDPASSQQHAMGIIDAIVNGQAALLSYADLFFYVAVLFVVSLPLLLFFGGGKPANLEAAAAAH